MDDASQGQLKVTWSLRPQKPQKTMSRFSLQEDLMWD